MRLLDVRTYLRNSGWKPEKQRVLSWLANTCKKTDESTSSPSKARYIGEACMDSNGTIRLKIDRGTCDELIDCPRQDPLYGLVFRYLGGIRPGQVKPVPQDLGVINF